MGNNLLRRPSEVLVRFSLDILEVRASQLREISGPVATRIWNFSTPMLGLFRRYCFSFFLLQWTVLCTKLSTLTVFFAAVTLRYNTWPRPCSSLQPWACLCIMSLQLADGANPGQDYLGNTDECLGTWRRFICKYRYFDVMVAASSLLSDQFICNLGGSKVAGILATSNYHGRS